MLWTLPDLRAWWRSPARFRWMRAVAVAAPSVDRAISPPQTAVATKACVPRVPCRGRTVRAWRGRAVSCEDVPTERSTRATPSSNLS